MVELIIDEKSSPPMTEIHIWIGHYADGTECMMATDFPVVGLITRPMPLMNSRRDIAESLAPLARKAQSASRHLTAPIIRVELRTFRAVMS